MPKTRDKPRVLQDMAFERQVKTKNLASRAAHGVSDVVTTAGADLVWEGASGDQTVKLVEIDFTVEDANSRMDLFWIAIIEWNQGASVEADFYGMLDGAPVFTAGVEQDNICSTRVSGNADGTSGTVFLAFNDTMSVGDHNFAVYAQQSTNAAAPNLAYVRGGHVLRVREDKRA